MSLSLTEKVKIILAASGSVNEAERAIKRIEKDAVNKHKQALSESVNFINIDDYDVVTDVYGDDGIRRFDVKNSVDGFVMIPSKDGYWSPYSDKVK